MQQDNLPDLLGQYMMYNAIVEKCQSAQKIDLENAAHLRPTCLLPLLVFVKSNVPPMKLIGPLEAQLSKIVQLTLGSSAGCVNYEPQAPFVVLPRSSSHFNPFFQRICDMCGTCGNMEKFRVMVDELTNNIYLHSRFDNAMVMAQHLSPSRNIELGIIDDGITIGGSLRNAGMMLEDGSALNAAVNGLSSRKEAGRGFGLSGSISTLIGDFNANVLLVSGQAIMHFDQHGPKGFIMRESMKLHGTLISIRLPARL